MNCPPPHTHTLCCHHVCFQAKTQMSAKSSRSPWKPGNTHSFSPRGRRAAGVPGPFPRPRWPPGAGPWPASGLVWVWSWCQEEASSCPRGSWRPPREPAGTGAGFLGQRVMEVCFWASGCWGEKEKRGRDLTRQGKVTRFAALYIKLISRSCGGDERLDLKRHTRSPSFFWLEGSVTWEEEIQEPSFPPVH